MATLSAPFFSWITLAQGPWVGTLPVTLKVIRMRDLVFCTLLNGMTGDFATSTPVTLTEPLPLAFRPPSDLSFSWPVSNNPSPEHGMFRVTTTGSLIWYSNANSGSFAAGINPVGPFASSVSWPVVN